jgi:sialic acid synthase SpsE
VKVGERWVGDGEPTLIIGEAGSNHDGSLDQAKALIDAAADSGIDVVKFQVFEAEQLLTRDHPAFAVIKANELPRAWLEPLVDHARRRGVIFAASPFDADAVDRLHKLDVPLYKWASPEIHDIPLLQQAARTGKALIISTGMSGLTDVQIAVETAREQGNDAIILLHCVSLYPTPAEHANLRMMDGLRHAFGLPVGFSDHTMSTMVPVAAVARGACVIEKHFTLSRTLKGPDHPFALEPAELAAMVRGIREVEVALGASVKQPLYGVERTDLNYKGLVAAVRIPKGTPIAWEMLRVKRAPPHGIKPVWLPQIVGRRAARDLQPDEPITWDVV